MDKSGLSSINQSISINLSQPKLRVLAGPKNSIKNLNFLCQSMTINNDKKYSVNSLEDKFKAPRLITLQNKTKLHSISESKIILNNRYPWKYSQKKMSQVQEQTNEFITSPPQPQMGLNGHEEWSLKCSRILTDLNNCRVAFDNRSKQKQQIFKKIKSMNKQFNKQKNILMRNRAHKTKAIQSLKQYFSSGISCKSIIPLYMSFLANKSKVKPKHERVSSQIKSGLKPTLHNSRYKDIPISKFIYEKQEEQIINVDFEAKLQKISRSLQQKTKRKWVSLGEKDYFN